VCLKPDEFWVKAPALTQSTQGWFRCAAFSSRGHCHCHLSSRSFPGLIDLCLGQVFETAEQECFSSKVNSEQITEHTRCREPVYEHARVAAAFCTEASPGRTTRAKREKRAYWRTKVCSYAFANCIPLLSSFMQR
jgi:hypothetical protein